MEKVFMITASNLLARVPPLFSDLAKILAGEIDCSLQTLTKNSSDASLFSVSPQAVVYPKNTTDIKHVLSFAREYKMPVTVRGGGSAATGGSIGEGIILDITRYFSQIRNVNMLENTITVDVGVKINTLLEKLHAWNFDIPLFDSSDTTSTIGGLLATKSITSSSFHHGTIREWVEGVTVVVDNGEEHTIADGITPSGRLLGIYQAVFPILTQDGGVLRASKPKAHDDPTGYNIWNTSIGPRQLMDQLTGSEGTLGIITSVTFRISPYKKHLLTTCIPVLKKTTLSSYIEIAKHHKAESIYLYDEAFMQLSERYHPTLTPYFEDTSYVLLVTHSGIDKETLHHTVRSFRRALPCEDHILKTLEGDDTLKRIKDVELLLSMCNTYTSGTMRPVTFGDGLIVALHNLPSFLEELEDYLNSLGKLYSISGNVGSGHVSAITFFDPLSQNYEEELSFYAKNIFTLAKKYNAGISALGGEGLARAPYLSYVYTEQALGVFKKIKEAWDPLLILNPGKKMGASTSYLLHHLKK